MRPFQFMIGTRGIPDPRALVEGARQAESIGFTAWAGCATLQAPDSSSST